MTVIALAGDWHGKRPVAADRIRRVAERGVTTLIHCGDFGLWPGNTGKKFLLGVDRDAERAGLEQVLVCPGNHEDWGRLTQLWASPRRRLEDGTPQPIALTDRVTFLPRGHRWSMGGRTFVALGGAPSLDFERRRPGRDWWSEEMIQPDDVERSVAGGYADVMVTHDAPEPATPPVAKIITGNPMSWSNEALEYAALGRARLTEAFLGVRPRLLVHGHFHVSGQLTTRLPGADHDTTVWSLADETSAGNLRLLDLDTLSDAVPASGREV